jgi:membrane protein DedA with SNARE-associated domain
VTGGGTPGAEGMDSPVMVGFLAAVVAGAVVGAMVGYAVGRRLSPANPSEAGDGRDAKTER